MSGQLSIFDILEDKPAIALHITFKEFCGVPRVITLELKDRSEIFAALQKCRDEHKGDLYFQYYEVTNLC